ncbi:putative glycolipid-binding domain-containing protein [Paenibacillus dendritiformis]|uniref:putative glycolipid-binding domain-containing protein n=1 Tax=Paenibacillus dendritiformis TaxID=130049 RepID=UPI00387E1D87
MEKTVIWRRIHGDGMEYCSHSFGTATRIEGKVICAEPGDRSFVEYTVSCDPDGCTREVYVRYEEPHQTRTLRLQRDDQNHWTVNGEPRDDLSGLKDIDIGVTPSTNVLPIRRMKLAAGEAAAVTAVWICFPQLTVQPLKQSYERLEDNAYLYRSIASGYTARLEVDDNGIALVYEDQWASL